MSKIQYILYQNMSKKSVHCISVHWQKWAIYQYTLQYICWISTRGTLKYISVRVATLSNLWRVLQRTFHCGWVVNFRKQSLWVSFCLDERVIHFSLATFQFFNSKWNSSIETFTKKKTYKLCFRKLTGFTHNENFLCNTCHTLTVK